MLSGGSITSALVRLGELNQSLKNRHRDKIIGYHTLDIIRVPSLRFTALSTTDMYSSERYLPSLAAPPHWKVLRIIPSPCTPFFRAFSTRKSPFGQFIQRKMFPNRKRKALLIGIKKAKGEDTLTRPHEDVYEMRNLLIGKHPL